jgi:hypothetical protein
MPLLLSIIYLKPEHLSDLKAEDTITIITYSSQLVFIIQLKHLSAFTTYLSETKLFHTKVIHKHETRTLCPTHFFLIHLTASKI